jgi:hypothetical protein
MVEKPFEVANLRAILDEMIYAPPSRPPASIRPPTSSKP